MSDQLAIQGSVIQPTHVSQPVSYPARDFFNVVRDVVHKVTFHNEADRLSALNAIDSYEKHVVPGADARAVVGEADRAPVEDVTQRIPPSTVPLAAPPGAQIDYARLAAAIVAAQQQQANTPQVSATVTDLPDA